MIPEIDQREEWPRKHRDGRDGQGHRPLRAQAARQRKGAHPQQDEMRDHVERVIRRHRDDGQQPCRWVGNLLVGIGEQGLPECDPGVPQGHASGGDQPLGRVGLCVPVEVDVALEEGLAEQHRAREQGHGQEGDRRELAHPSREPAPPAPLPHARELYRASPGRILAC